jgi:hypothetical protein
MMSCFMSLLFAMSLVTPCETPVRLGLERPYAFTETPIRPLSIAFEQDTRAYVKHDGYELSLDLWRMPSAGIQRPPMGIDLWSLMIGIEF